VPERESIRPYERVLADMRRRLAAGEWAEGTALPSVAALAAHYRVGHGTITRVVRTLVADGLVHTVRRWGIFAGPAPAGHSGEDANPL